MPIGCPSEADLDEVRSVAWEAEVLRCVEAVLEQSRSRADRLWSVDWLEKGLKGSK